MTEVDARKEKIDDKRAWQLLKDAARVYIGIRGKYSRWDSIIQSREEIMLNAMGRSGNLRAPAIRIGDVYLVGYNEEMYKSVL